MTRKFEPTPGLDQGCPHCKTKRGRGRLIVKHFPPPRPRRVECEACGWWVYLKEGETPAAAFKEQQVAKGVQRAAS